MMKTRIVGAVMAATLAFGMSACGGGDDEPQDDQVTENPGDDDRDDNDDDRDDDDDDRDDDDDDRDDDDRDDS